MNKTSDPIRYALRYASGLSGMELNDAESSLITLASAYRLELKENAKEVEYQLLLEQQYQEIVDWAWANIPQSGNIEWDKMIDRHTKERGLENG